MLPLTRHGTREMIVGTVVLLAIAAGLFYLNPYLPLIVLPVLIWLFAFFRDPERPTPSAPHLMVSPADGMVSDVEQLPDHPLLRGPCVRVGISSRSSTST